VRATEAISPTAVNEMARLSEENAKLRLDLEKLTRNQVSDAGFEVVTAQLISQADPHDRNHFRNFRVQIRIQATIREGVPVGFSPNACLVGIEGIRDEPILTECKFASDKGAIVEKLIISGPIEFQVTGTAGFEQWHDRIPTSGITLVVYLRPIGYVSGYSIKVPMEYVKEGDREMIWKRHIPLNAPLVDIVRASAES
jgi:hypothetical protein